MGSFRLVSQVTAAAHDEWLALANQDTAGAFDAGNETLLYFCDNGLDDEEGRFCNLCESAVACYSSTLPLLLSRRLLHPSRGRERTVYTAGA